MPMVCGDRVYKSGTLGGDLNKEIQGSEKS